MDLLNRKKLKIKHSVGQTAFATENLKSTIATVRAAGRGPET